MRRDPPGSERIEDLLAALDHPVPAVTAADVMRRARGGSAEEEESAVRRRVRNPNPGALRAAAVVAALAIGVGTAWAMPGSPLRGWVEALRARGASSPATAPGTATVDVQPAPERGQVGVVLPADSVSLVSVERGVGEGWMRVVLTDGADLEVRSPVASTRFATLPGALAVEHAAPDTLGVAVPRAASLEIRVDGRAVFAIDRGAVTASAPPLPDGSWLIPLGPRD